MGGGRHRLRRRVGPGPAERPGGRRRGGARRRPDALDGAISTNTVYFWAQVEPSLAELARVIRPGGTLVLGLADPSYFDGRPFDEHGFHIRSVADIGAALEDAGFDGPTDHPVDIDRTIFHLLEARRPT